MGSAINLDKIKQVHAEMHERRELFAKAKERCDWSHELIPRKRSTLFEAADDNLDRIAAKIVPDKPRPKRIDAKPRQYSSEARRITHNGKCLTISEWAEATGIAGETIRYRLTVGWSEEEAVTIAVGNRQRKIAADDRRQVITPKPKAEPRVADKSLALLAAEHGISRQLIVDRLCRGLSLDAAIAAALNVPARAAMGRPRKATGGWVQPSQDEARTGGVGSRDTKAKQDFFQ